MPVEHRFVLFADIKGFSKLREQDVPALMGAVWGRIGSILEPHHDDVVLYNTWGDALFLVFRRAGVVAAVLEIRDWFRQHPRLAVRIACHFGDFFEYQDDFLKRPNAVGANINLAARIEPITRPNSIFVTRPFKTALEGAADPGKPADLAFDPLGEIELAKKFGQEELFLLRRNDESQHILDRLRVKDLSRALPDYTPLSAAESAELKALEGLSAAQLRGQPPIAVAPDGANAAFAFGLAELHKNRGNYDIAESLLDGLVNVSLDADGLEVRPFQHEIGFVKLRANVATRQGKYDLAHQLLYGLYKSGSRDNDTLTMLASCYKRRAFFDAAGRPRPAPLGTLLERSRDLYLEAVRRDIGDYYPLINAAYAHAFLGQDGLAVKLALYCQEILRESRGRDWWSASTYAETEVIQGDYEVAATLLREAVASLQPEPFHLDALVDQLELLASVRKAAPLDELVDGLSA